MVHSGCVSVTLVDIFVNLNGWISKIPVSLERADKGTVGQVSGSGFSCGTRNKSRNSPRGLRQIYLLFPEFVIVGSLKITHEHI